MANEANNIINKEIDERLRKIMEQRNIHNEASVNDGTDTTERTPIKINEAADEIFTERKPRGQKIHPLNPVLKGKFHYNLPRYLKFPDLEFSVKIRKLSTFSAPVSTTAHFLWIKFSFPLGRHHFLCYTYLS